MKCYIGKAREQWARGYNMWVVNTNLYDIYTKGGDVLLERRGGTCSNKPVPGELIKNEISICWCMPDCLLLFD